MKKKFKSFIYKNIMFKIPLSFINLPTPMNINYMWNFGSMLGIFLMIQIISGLFLSMHYCPNINLAFKSISHIMKDVNSGWLIRLIHMNGASFYFILMYFHISRNLYYYSFKLNYVWLIGSLILFMSMATAFLGYVLPWGQMSFWGAMVITNLLSALPYIGKMIVEWVWGGFSINNSTLNRFYSFHFILPLIIMFMVFLHLMILHLSGSSNPIHLKYDIYKIPFYPYFLIKDLITIILILSMFMFLNLQYPYMFGDSDNFKMANPMITPSHIKPEWYFLFAYSILRSVPSKLGGVIMLFMSIFILFFLPLINNNMKNTKFYPLNKYIYWMFINIFIMLTWLGKQMIEYPYINLNEFYTMMYYSYYLFLFMISNLIDLMMKKNK
ncbi:cytochrome b (mitochondrion) [Frieseomelitta varia]|uniref:Cytochrome b n=1 Tax=Frieseomelitta varia TaxID=561572 RepID=A0A833RX52_9HYME|nr:cytochrome b [Frieseomelitta varia]